MKKTFFIFVLGGVLGFIVGGGAMLVVYPFIFPPPVLNEKVNNAGVVVADINFREDSAGQDSGHWGKGSLKVYRNDTGDITLELQEDFEVGPGPNFWLYLNASANIEKENDFYADNGRIKVAKIKSFTGSQVYTLAKEDYAKAKAITIWCESFGQYIASANLPE